MGSVSDNGRESDQRRPARDSLARSASAAAPGSPRCRWASPAAPPWGWASGSVARPAEQVSEQMQQRAAEQLFRVLGELKGGAMKFGQALSLFESVLPEDVAAPYRAQLSRLQDAAPPMPTSRVHAVLARELGPRLAGLVHRLRARSRPRPPRSVRSTGRPGPTGVRSR